MSATEHLGRAKIWAISCGVIGAVLFAYLVGQVNSEGALGSATTVLGAVIGLVMGYGGGVLLYTASTLCTWAAKKLS